MIKKVVFGIVLLGLIGILVAGAVVRTIDKTGNVAEAQGAGAGNGRAYSLQDQQAGEAPGRQGQGFYGGQGRVDGRGDGTAAGYGQGSGGGQGSLANPQADVEEWLTIEGTVTSVDADALVVRTTGGEQVVVENRPWWFAQQQGFSAQAGDQVTLVGFYEGSDLETGQITDATNGLTVQIRDETGRPLWAGRRSR